MSIRQDLKRKLAERKVHTTNVNGEDENDDAILDPKRPRELFSDDVISPHDPISDDEDCLHLNDFDDNSNEDSDYVDEGSISGDDNIKSKDSRMLLRRRNIRVPGDSKCELILRDFGLYKHLRRNIGKTKPYSVKEANQIVKKVSCYIAYVCNMLYNERINPKNTVKVLQRTLKPSGHQLVYDYVEMLAKEGTMPLTLSHQIDYVKAAARWAQNCVKKCRRYQFTPFKEYAADLVKQVLTYISCIVSPVVDVDILFFLIIVPACR